MLLCSNGQYTELQQKTHCEFRSGFGVSRWRVNHPPPTAGRSTTSSTTITGVNSGAQAVLRIALDDV